MTTIWLQPPAPGSDPIEVEYTREKIVPLMVQGHRQVPAPAKPAPSSATTAEPKTIWLQPPAGGPAIEVEAVPDILTPYMNQGYREVPAPKA